MWLYNTPLTFVVLCLDGGQAGEDEEEAGSDGGHGGITVLLVCCGVTAVAVVPCWCGVDPGTAGTGLALRRTSDHPAGPLRPVQPPAAQLPTLWHSSELNYLFIDYLHIYPSENRTVQ